MQRQHEDDNSRLFNLDRSEELNVADLQLFDKDTKLPTQGQKTIVASLDKESRPLSVVLRPYVEGFLKGAGHTAGAVAGYGQQALKAMSGVLWWGFEGIKSIFAKTTEYIKPKFVLLTEKKEPNQEQLELIDRLQRDKELAVLGVNQLNELKHVSSGKVQVAVPVDEQFLEYLRNQKFAVKQRDWIEDVDPTKTIMMPSQSFAVLVNTFEAEGKRLELPRKQVYNYGQFCVFEMEGKNEIEYQFLEKLRMSKDHLEGFMVRTADIEKQDSSNDSRPDQQALLVNQEVKKPTAAQNATSNTVPVKVKEVPLIEYPDVESREIQLN